MTRGFLVLLLASLSAGCGSGLGEVTGTVNYDGKPLERGTIRFETTGARPAIGRIENGKIVEVTTFKGNDGVPPGSHKVAVYSFAEVKSAGTAAPKNPGDPSGGTASMSPPSLIPAIYNDLEKSGLTAEIKPGKNEVKFDLKKQ